MFSPRQGQHFLAHSKFNGGRGECISVAVSHFLIGGDSDNTVDGATQTRITVGHDSYMKSGWATPWRGRADFPGTQQNINIRDPVGI